MPPPIPRRKVRRAAILLNDGDSRRANARLASLTGASPATVKGWQADQTASYRKEMSATARRLLAVLLVLKSKALLDDGLLREAQAVEAHMIAGHGRLADFLANLTGRRNIADESENQP